jgi:hypothetical protein
MIKVMLFSYNRPEMLNKIVGHLSDNGINYHVLDDGSDNFDIDTIVPKGFVTRFTHGGKEKFWLKYMYAVDMCKKSAADTFIFLQDDCLDLNIDELKVIAEHWKDSEYVINLINDGRDQCWGRYRMGLKPIETDNNKLIEIGFCDCIFMTNRKSLRLVEIKPVPKSWFDRPDKSSGIGAQFTKQFRALGVPMLKPEKSFCFHGDHPSTMHTEHRKQLPLISK